MILLSNTAHSTKTGGQALIGGLDVTVKRNAFGTQLDSFVADLSVPAIGGLPFPAVFIRAPIIESVNEANVQVLATVRPAPKRGAVSEEAERVVAVRQSNLLATAFHPELTNDDRFHRYFLQMVEELSTKNAP